MALNLVVKIHPVVLFQIVDAYERRNADSHRVIGTLLGKTNSNEDQPLQRFFRRCHVAKISLMKIENT